MGVIILTEKGKIFRQPNPLECKMLIYLLLTTNTFEESKIHISKLWMKLKVIIVVFNYRINPTPLKKEKRIETQKKNFKSDYQIVL